jgi:hypothetical protein
MHCSILGYNWLPNYGFATQHEDGSFTDDKYDYAAHNVESPQPGTYIVTLLVTITTYRFRRKPGFWAWLSWPYYDGRYCAQTVEKVENFYRAFTKSGNGPWRNLPEFKQLRSDYLESVITVLTDAVDRFNFEHNIGYPEEFKVRECPSQTT